MSFNCWWRRSGSGRPDATAKANPFGFSTKYQDDETDLLYYSYRYYHASTGKRMSRDRIKDANNHNLYCLIGNNPLKKVDVLGLA
jgi:RHS repeat-associated protein